jgi:predicted nucleic acid-binding protein
VSCGAALKPKQIRKRRPGPLPALTLYLFMLLLDSDICIDLLRGYSPALAWYASLAERPGLPGLAAMELMAGCQNGRQMRTVRKFIRRFRLSWPTEADCGRAFETYSRASLSHNLGLIDALIGECAVGLGATLCTFNTKHYRAVPNLAHQRPYKKS